MTDNPAKKRLLSEVASSAGEAVRLRGKLDETLEERDQRALRAQVDGGATYAELQAATGLTRIGVSKMLAREKSRQESASA